MKKFPHSAHAHDDDEQAKDDDDDDHDDVDDDGYQETSGACKQLNEKLTDQQQSFNGLF